MLKFHNSDLWIAWMVVFCMEGSRFDLHTGQKACVGALDVTVSQSSVQVARGQAAILSCSFSTSAALTNLNVIWMVIPLSNANQPEQVIIYQGGQVFSLAPQLAGRVGFVSTMPSTVASIVINSTQLTDTGTYQCLVNNLPDRGGRNIGVIGLTVLVPPSVPVCALQGSLDVGSDIVLACGSDEGIPTPSYSWEKMDNLPGNRLPHNAMQDQMAGTVSIRNISTSTSGLYQCSSTNVIGKSTCVLNVQVVAPQPQSVTLIAGSVASGILAVVICSLLVTVTWFYWRNRNKYEEDEIPNEIREDDLPPKRSSSSVKAFQADASSSENDTLTSTNTYSSQRYWQQPNNTSPGPKAPWHQPSSSPGPKAPGSYEAQHSYTRYNGDTHRTFSSTAHHGHRGHHGHEKTQGSGHLVAPGSAPLSRHAHHHQHHQQGGATTTTSFANGSHTLPPPKTLVVTANSAPSPPPRGTSSSSNGIQANNKLTSAAAAKTHSYAVSQATLERMGAVPVMVPAQSRAGSLV